MIRHLVIAALCAIIGIPAASLAQEKKPQPAKEAPIVPPRKGEREVIKLFNGKDLEGWEGYKNLWSVKDGVIIGKNDKPLKVSTYLFTKQKFSDFRLLFGFKLGDINEMHSGLALWGKRITAPDRGDDPHGEFTYQGHLVMFPTDWGLFDLYRRAGKINVSKEIRAVQKKAGKQHDWNDLELLAQGNRIRLVVNGKLTLDWRESEPKLIDEGPIALQLHSNQKPQEVYFKGLELTTFPEDKLLTAK
jgi:hypothetical protein